MFNLGFKQIVINSESVVKYTAGASGQPHVIEIEGFGRFITKPSGTIGSVTASVAPALGVYTAVIPNFDSTKKYDLKLRVKHARDVSEAYNGHSGDIWTFQTGAGASFGLAAAAGQIAGFNDDKVKFTANGADLVITFQAGWEGAELKSLEVIETESETYMPVTSISIDTAPEYGIGLGKMIEEEVMNATEANLDPYGIKTGGKDGAVDVRGTYTEIMWETELDDNDFEPHEMLGYGDANTETTYAKRKYIAYVNEASAKTAITNLTKLAVNTPNTV